MKIRQLSLAAILFVSTFIFSSCGSNGSTRIDLPSRVTSSSPDSVSSYSKEIKGLEKVNVDGFDHDVYKYEEKYYALFDEQLTLIEAERKALSIGGHLLVDNIENVMSAFAKNEIYDVKTIGGYQILLGAYKTGKAFFRYKDNSFFAKPSSSVDSNYGTMLYGLSIENDSDETNSTSKKATTFYADSLVARRYVVEWDLFESIGKSITSNYIFELPNDIETNDNIPEGTNIYKYGDHYYALFTSKKNWSDAELYCENMGGHLLCVSNDDENVIFSRIYAAESVDKSNTWLGYIRLDDNGNIVNIGGTFKWVDGSDSDYANWYGGQPNNYNNVDNAAIYNGENNNNYKWNDYPYNQHSYNFICEWDNKDNIGNIVPSFYYKGVSTQEELIAALNGNGRYMLTNDIYLDSDFTYVEKFAGQLLGNGHIISIPNKTIDEEHPYNFIKELTGTLDNVIFEVNVSTSNTLTGLGGIVHTNNGKINSCVLEGEIDARNVDKVGGFAANGNGLFSNSTNKADIIGHNYVGGFLGEKTSTNELANLTNEGNIIGNDYVGGIIGDINNNLYRTSASVVFNDNVNKGDIEGKNYVGGLVGHIYCGSDDWQETSVKKGSPTVSFNANRNVNYGNIVGNDYVGGVFGYAVSDITSSKIEKCDSFSNIEGRSYVGCIAGYLGSIAIDECSNKDSTLIINNVGLSGSTKISYVGGIVGRGYKVSNCGNELDISAQGQYVGGIAGYTNELIEKCTNSGNIASTEAYVGGIAGRNQTGIIECYNSGNITSTNNYVGGISGYAYLTTTIKDSSNDGDIQGDNYVGGIVGNIDDNYYRSTQTLTIDNNSNTGGVEGKNYVGGLVGHIYCGSDDWQETSVKKGSPTVTLLATRNINTGDIDGKENYVGGVFGYAVSDITSSKIEKCDSFANIRGRSYVGGIVGYAGSIIINNCSNKDSTITINGVGLSGSTKISYVGGIVGRGYKVSNCDNELDISAQGQYVGGIAGYINGDISNCSNSGDITSTDDYVGGIAGFAYHINSIVDLTNIGAIKGKNYVAGIIGRIDDNYYRSTQTLNIENMANDGNIEGEDYVSGLFGHVYCGSDDWQETSVKKGSPTVTLKLSFSNNDGTIVGNEGKIGAFFAYAYSDTSASFIILCDNSVVDLPRYGSISGVVDKDI